MAKFISIKPLDSQLAPGKSVLKAAEYRHLVSYEELLKTLAQREREREARLTEAMTKAIQSGMEQGREQAHHQLVDQLLGHTIRMHESLRDVELALVDVVVDAVQQIVRQFDDKVLVTNTVRRGLDLVRGSKKLIVRVHPQMQEVVGEQLQEWQKTISHIEVIADTQLRLDECILESDVGIVNASVELQVESLVKSLRKAFPVPRPRNS